MKPKISLIQSLFGIFKTKVLSIIDYHDPGLKKRKVSNEFVLEQVLKVLKKGYCWRDATTDDVSYSTVYKRFIHWVRIDLFKKIWSCLLDLYVSNKLKISKDWFKVIFIDTTMVKNVRGLDCKGRNHYDRNRFATKVSMVCDKNMVPLCSTFYPANNHDITTIDSTLAALHHDILPDKRYLHTLVADLGYLSNNQRKEYLRDTYRISLLTPYRKNQNKRNKRHEKKLLNKRVVIEHLFCRLDSFKRLKLREDGLLRNYSGLNYLAMALITISKM